MIPWVVAIGGPAGSGKSTVGRKVAAALGLEFRSVGELFRAEASSRGLDLEAFGRYAEEHPEVDRELDRRMLVLAHPGVVLEGRVQGALLRRERVPVRTVRVTAAREVRLRRLVARDGGTPEGTAARLATREASERSRYRAFYGIDPDAEPVDLTVDATTASADEVAERIVRFLLDSSAEGAGA